MDDISALQRTVRRCTAILVAGIGATIWTLAGPESALVGFVLIAGGLLYLGGSLVFVPEWDTETDASDTTSGQ